MGFKAGRSSGTASPQARATVKTTIEIPDELYRKVKAKSAIEGRHVRDVTIELYRHWVEGKPAKRVKPAAARAWLEEWLKLGEEASRNAPPGPSAREILEQDRSRLDRR
jgi:hypothetical protein